VSEPDPPPASSERLFGTSGDPFSSLR
jgi:hypothetical protein